MANRFIKARFHFDGAAVFPILNLQYDDDSYSRGLAQIVRNFVAGKNDISADDLKDWHDELERLSEAGDIFSVATDTSSGLQNRPITQNEMSAIGTKQTFRLGSQCAPLEVSGCREIGDEGPMLVPRPLLASIRSRVRPK